MAETIRKTRKKITAAANVENICLIILSAVAVAFTLYFTRPVAIPFVISLLIYTLLAPVIRYVTKKTGLPHLIVISLTFLSIIALLALAVVFVSNSIGDFIRGADVYRDKLLSTVNWAAALMAKYDISVNSALIADTFKNLPVFNFVRGLGSVLLSLMSGVFLVSVFLLFFFAGSNSNLRVDKKPNYLTLQIQSKISFYLTAKIVVSLVTGIAVWIVLAAFRVEMAFMFGLITFLLNFIPLVGSVIAVILPLPVAFLQYYDAGPKFLIILLLLVSLQFILGNIIEPKIMGDGTDMHPVTIVLALVFWSLIWGIPGAFLAVPVTAAIQAVLSNFELTKPVTELMAGRI